MEIAIVAIILIAIYVWRKPINEANDFATAHMTLAKEEQEAKHALKRGKILTDLVDKAVAPEGAIAKAIKAQYQASMQPATTK
tara:strand:+ start:1739 stop:1987 length:249 start_codon:yes stop_codon:yes gene_type:complete